MSLLLLNSVSTWGDYNFTFSVDVKLETSGGVSALVARAYTSGNIPLPIACKWRRRLKDQTVSCKSTST